MGNTVYAEGMGLFHKGSGGKGIAPADVCLTPPPPPAGPLPVPYVNVLSASDLADGSSSVKIQGEPTALEDKSSISTSTGDEAGTQGGSVITHKTKGKGYFSLWSFTVKIEGKGVCRHGDPIGQNCMSGPPACVDATALVNFANLDWVDTSEPCAEPYVRPTRTGPLGGRQPTPSTDQTNFANTPNPPGAPLICWQCLQTIPPGGATADHQPPLNVAWYMGGCHDPIQYNAWAFANEGTIQPHCSTCSPSQGGAMGSFSRNVTSDLDQISSHQAKLEQIMDWMPSG